MQLLPERFTLLIACDDPDQLGFLAEQLTADGFDVDTADTTAAATRVLSRSFPDAVIIGTRMPDRSGLDLVTALRDQRCASVDPATPVVALTALEDPLERVRALERGADDVLGGPLHYPELLARLRAVLRRRAAVRRPRRVQVGRLSLDPASRQVVIGETPIALSGKEYALLHVLAADPTRVFRKDELLREVWGFRASGRTRTLDSHACRLRQKLAAAGGRYVINVWGVGYRLCDPPLHQHDAGADRPLLAA